MLEMETRCNRIRERLWDSEGIHASRMAIICGLWIAPFPVHTLPSLSLFLLYQVKRNAWIGNLGEYLPGRKYSVLLSLSDVICFIKQGMKWQSAHTRGGTQRQSHSKSDKYISFFWTGAWGSAVKMAKQKFREPHWVAQQGSSLEWWYSILCFELPWEGHSGFREELPDCPWQWP